MATLPDIFRKRRQTPGETPAQRPDGGSRSEGEGPFRQIVPVRCD